MSSVASVVIQDEGSRHFRALVGTPLTEGGARIDLVLDEDVRLELSVAELNFILRAARAFPEAWLSEMPEHQRAAQLTEGCADAQPTPPPDGAASAKTLGKGDPSKPARHGARWEDSEEEELVKALQAGASLDALCERFGRTKGSIVSKLVAHDAVEVVPKRR